MGPDPQISPNSTPTVLVVDDDDESRAVIKKTLAPLAINIIEADNGRAALELLKHHAIDVVISDLVMPVMSGLMLLHSMLEQGQQLPFILITGFGDKDSAIQALRLGAFDYLEKPFGIPDLLEVVREALKVSQAQLLTAGRRSPGAAGSAETAIMQMRALQFGHDHVEFGVRDDGAQSWPDVKQRFIAEVEPQLVFTLGSLRNLEGHPERTQEFSYLRQVVQSIRQASEAARLNHIAEIAWEMESTLHGLHAAANAVSPTQLELLRQAHACLSKKVSELQDSESELLTGALQALRGRHSA